MIDTKKYQKKGNVVLKINKISMQKTIKIFQSIRINDNGEHDGIKNNCYMT